jgi:peptidoglycan hydrolase CwlO-like protein
MRCTKQLKEESAKAKADVEKTEKALADAKNVITSKDTEVSTLKEQLAHLQVDFDLSSALIASLRKQIAAMKQAIDGVCIFPLASVVFILAADISLDETKPKFQ